MNEKQLKDAFKSYKFSNWKTVLDFVFGKVEYFSSPNNPFSEDKKVVSGKQYGRIKLDDGKSIALFEVQVDDDINIDRNRQGLREIAARHIDQNITHGALVFFYSPTQHDYRLTFIAKWSELNLETGELQKGETQKKRYTYLLGKNESGTTAAKRLLELANKKPVITINNVISAFSVEPIKKEFFKKYKEHYERFWRYIDEKPQYQKLLLDKEKESEDDKRKPIRDFSKKLLGRIVFLHFLQKKGWMGCPVLPTEKENDEIWENGDPHFMYNLFDDFADKEHFYSKCLTKLFFSTLNETGRTNNVFSITGTRVPYLNGGLFDNDQLNTDNINFPENYFQELLDFFCQYNFTIDENSPDEQEIGIDPEMLGHIFENLLEENREKGAFYTPKEIVHYMCQESLVQYLNNHFPGEAKVDDFIRRQQVSEYLRQRENALRLNTLLDKVKVCDPAIGSGAFPIGILQEIYLAKRYIYPYLNNIEAFDPAETKKKIIQESIYGVDLEYGAVEIARLRFWLALVVDEDKPQPLPNLDYKIMQGNSLLESYEGIDLSKVAFLKNLRVTIVELSLFEEPANDYGLSDADKKSIEELIASYFELESKEEKIKTHKRIDKLVIEHIDKSLEFYENKMLIEIADFEKKLERKTENLNADQKQKLIAKSREQKEIEARKKSLNSKAEARKKLLQFEHTHERPYFLWHLFFKDVFDKGGFDIVIGNPPYIQLQKLGREADILEDEGFKSFFRTGDVYCLFYEKSINLLKFKGVISFITSNSWLKTKYGEPLRKFFRQESDPLILINFEDTKLFFTATVEVNIYIAKKQPNNYSMQAVSVVGDLIKNDIPSYLENNKIIINDYDDKGWLIADKETYLLKTLIEEGSEKLNELSIEISRGIITGLNEAFVVSTNLRDRIINQDENCGEIIKKFVGGRNLKRFSFEWNNEWVLYMHSGISEYSFPPIINHLEPYKQKLLERRGGMNPKTKELPYDWWQLQVDYYSSGTFKNYDKPKIMWAELSDKQKFVYDDENFYPNKTLFIITGENLKVLLAILNSKVAGWYFNQISTSSGMGTTIWSKYKVEQLPIKTSNSAINGKLSIIASYLVYLYKNEFKASLDILSNAIDTFEEILNMLTYELYFEDHVKDLDLDISSHISFPAIDSIELQDEKVKKISEIIKLLNEKNNPIRNRILVADSRSWIIKKINQTVQ